jgi:uncharacterized membrane protein HdeD (DUF308 family)
MKGLRIVLGALLEALGIWLILQGAGVVSTGAMAGETRWIVIGVVVDAVGTLLIVSALWKRGTQPPP